MSQINSPLLMIQNQNLLIRFCWNKQQTHNHKDPSLNEESSTDNDEVTKLNLIPPTNGVRPLIELVVRHLIIQRRVFQLSTYILSPWRMKVYLVLQLKW